MLLIYTVDFYELIARINTRKLLRLLMVFYERNENELYIMAILLVYRIIAMLMCIKVHSLHCIVSIAMQEKLVFRHRSRIHAISNSVQLHPLASNTITTIPRIVVTTEYPMITTVWITSF